MMRATIGAVLLALVVPGAALANDEEGMLRHLFSLPIQDWRAELEDHRHLLTDTFFERCRSRIEWALSKYYPQDASRFQCVAEMATDVVGRREPWGDTACRILQLHPDVLCGVVQGPVTSRWGCQVGALAGAEVRVNGGLVTHTDSTGRFVFWLPPTEPCSLEVRWGEWSRRLELNRERYEDDLLGLVLGSQALPSPLTTAVLRPELIPPPNLQVADPELHVAQAMPGRLITEEAVWEYYVLAPVRRYRLPSGRKLAPQDLTMEPGIPCVFHASIRNLGAAPLEEVAMTLVVHHDSVHCHRPIRWTGRLEPGQSAELHVPLSVHASPIRSLQLREAGIPGGP
ncbi:MAG: hypothetical protein AB1758_22580 [Candidatus Eremiobacterota bacterium]